jgi:hypothetical protein
LQLTLLKLPVVKRKNILIFMIMSIFSNYCTPNDLMTVSPEEEEGRKKKRRKN